MKNLKKILSLLLVLAMVLSVAACGKTEEKKPEEPKKTEGEKKDEGEKKPDEKKPAEDVTVTYLVLGSGTDKDEVTAKINERLAELKAGYKVELVLYGWDNYGEKLGLAARGTGDKFDIATVASWLGPYGTLVNEETLLDLKDLLPKAAPVLKETLTQTQLDGAMMKGGLYAIPTRATAVHARDYFVWNVKALEEIGVKVEEVAALRTVESLEPVLAKYKEKYPDRFPLDGGSEWAIRRVDSLVNTDKDGKAVIGNMFATPEFKKALEVIKGFAEKGYISPEAGSDQYKQDEPDQWLVKRAEGEPGAEALWTDGFKTPVKAVLTAEDIFTRSDMIQGKMTAVYKHSKNPEQALNFIEKIATDATIQNLLAWGIEGKHYTLKDGKAVATEARNEGWNLWQNQLVSDKTRLPNPLQKAQDDPALVEEVKAFEAELKPAADLGFTPSAAYLEKFAAIKAVKDKHYKALARGKMETYDQFLKDLEAAGIKEAVEMLQKEYDAWKK
ncbi:MAG: extracellular solute-binding protein [Tissierellia bacterium]|nr:extracellular solute-binding protein [Tissierellia bacterium]